MIRPTPAFLLALLALAAPLPAQEAEVVVAGETGRAIDAHLERLAALGFAGGAIVVDGGEVVLRKGYGLADRAREIPIGPGTVFNLGSITKQFTAAAILALEARGALAVEDSIGRFFPDAPAGVRGITIHQLLTHSAGFRSDFGGDYDALDRATYLGRAFGSELLFEPGTAYEYANANYSVLAAIVEVVTGKEYEAALKELVLDPAGMTETGYTAPAWDAARVAHGYRGGEDWGTIVERIAVPGAPFWNLRGNGGLHTTLDDMARWHVALADDRILPAEQRAKMFTPWIREGDGAPTHYGYGWSIEETPRRGTLVTHNGGNGVYVAELFRFVDRDVMVFLASTVAEMPASAAVGAVIDLAFGESVEPPPAVVRLEPAELARWAGDYALADGDTIRVVATDAGLELQPLGPRAFALLGGGLPETRRSAAEAKTDALVRGILAGDAAAIETALGGPAAGGPDAAMVLREESGLLADRRGRLGASRGFSILGTSARGDVAATTVRFDFDRGWATTTYEWGPAGRLVGARAAPRPEPARYAPVGPARFVAFRLRGGGGPAIEFAEGASGISLQVEGPGGPVEALRSAGD